MCYLYSLQFSCLLFVLCPVIRNSLLQSAYNSSNVFLGPLRTCTATASLTNGSRQGRLTWALESSGLLSHPWDDVLRAIHQTQAVQQSWAELASHWHVRCFSWRGSAVDTDSYCQYQDNGECTVASLSHITVSMQEAFAFHWFLASIYTLFKVHKH